MSRCGFERCCACCGDCVADLRGGGCAAALALLAGEDDCDPDDRNSEGVPENRGISLGGTMSTTIASGGGGSGRLAAKSGRPSSSAATWAPTETTRPGRMNRFNPIILGCVDTAPRRTGIISATPKDCHFIGGQARYWRPAARPLPEKRKSGHRSVNSRCPLLFFRKRDVGRHQG